MRINNSQGLAVRDHLFRSHEEEMFHSVGHTRHIICIAKASNVDVDSSSSFVCIRVVDEKGFELVWQSYDTVGSIIERWSFQLVCDAFYGSHTGKGMWGGSAEAESRSECSHNGSCAAKETWTMGYGAREDDRSSVESWSHVRHVVKGKKRRGNRYKVLYTLLAAQSIL